MVRTFYCLGLLPLLCMIGSAQNENGLEPRNCTFVGSVQHVCKPEVFAENIASAKKVAIIAVEANPTWAELAEHLDPKISDREYNRLRERYFDTYVAPRIRLEERAGARTRFKELTRRDRSLPKSSRGVLSRSRISEESPELRKRVEKWFGEWGRFSVVTDPELATLVVELRYYQRTGFGGTTAKPVSYILVWPNGADPETDELLWLEEYRGKWARSDSVAGLLRLFRHSVELADRVSQ